MRLPWVLGISAVALVLGPAVGHAAEQRVTLSFSKEYTASPWTSEMGYGPQAMGKLKFGLKNLLLGWTDLVVEPKEAANAGENLLVGIGHGVKDAVENTLGGVVHTATFFLPQVDAPLPEGGVQLM